MSLPHQSGTQGLHPQASKGPCPVQAGLPQHKLATILAPAESLTYIFSGQAHAAAVLALACFLRLRALSVLTYLWASPMTMTGLLIPTRLSPSQWAASLLSQTISAPSLAPSHRQTHQLCTKTALLRYASADTPTETIPQTVTAADVCQASPTETLAAAVHS